MSFLCKKQTQKGYMKNDNNVKWSYQRYFSSLKIQMKILLVPFNHYCKRYHTNENIACFFFIVTNFKISVYKGIIIQFLLVT